MKKFFAFLMLAAAMITGCNTPEPGPGTEPKPDEEKFYGLTLNDAEVVNRGDYYNDGTNSYLVYLYKVEGDVQTRIFAGEIITPEVNDGVIPAGKYTMADGKLVEGSLDPILAGSFFIRNVEEDGYVMLATEGYLEVKHLETAGQYQLTASLKGIDAMTGEAKALQEGRFEGTPRMLGLAASNNFEVFTPYGAQAMYTSLGDGMAMYDLIVADKGAFDGTSFPIHLAEFVLLTEDLGVDVLPQGTFPIDYFGLSQELGVQYVNAQIVVDASGDKTIDMGRDGYVTIKGKGEGKYSIEAVTFGENAGYKVKFEGDVYLYEEENGTTYNIDLAQANFQGEYEGNTWWVLFLGDTSADRLFQLYVNTPADCTAANGIPSGTYTVAATMEPGTIDEGYVDEEGYVNGSMVLNMAQTGVYAYLTGGELNLVNNGDGTYSIDFDFLDHNSESMLGEYEGAMKIVDESEGGSTGGGGGEDLNPVTMNIDVAEMQFLGLGEWILLLGDTSKDAVYMLDVYQNEDATFADGLASGTYTVAETYEHCTIWPGYVDEEGYVGGSMLLNFDMTQAYDILQGGEMVVENTGNGNYNISIAFEGMSNYVTGSYTGEVPAYDGTQGVAPKKVAAKMAAPAKSVKNTKKNQQQLTLVPNYLKGVFEGIR